MTFNIFMPISHNDIYGKFLMFIKTLTYIKVLFTGELQ